MEFTFATDKAFADVTDLFTSRIPNHAITPLVCVILRCFKLCFLQVFLLIRAPHGEHLSVNGFWVLLEQLKRNWSPSYLPRRCKKPELSLGCFFLSFFHKLSPSAQQLKFTVMSVVCYPVTSMCKDLSLSAFHFMWSSYLLTLRGSKNRLVRY